jgi:hypothetical protein
MPAGMMRRKAHNAPQKNRLFLKKAGPHRLKAGASFWYSPAEGIRKARPSKCAGGAFAAPWHARRHDAPQGA